MKHKKSMKMPSKPKIPIEAEREIMGLLEQDMSVETNVVADILERHGVCGDIHALQQAYRKRIGQRLMASVRDENGKREILCDSKHYVVLGGCNDRRRLKSIRGKLLKGISGLDASAKKVRERLSFLERMFGGNTKWRS